MPEVKAPIELVPEKAGNIELVTTLRVMLVLRVVIITTLLGAALYVQVFYGVPSDTLYFIIGTTYLLTLFYAVLTTPLRNSHTFVFVQLVIDEILVSVLVLATGGIESAFLIFYYIPVVTAAVALGRFSSIMLAVLGAAMFAVLAIAANSGLMNLDVVYPFSHPSIGHLLYSIGLQVTALLLVAALSGYLASLLQITAAKLRQRTIDLRQLQVLNENIVRSITSGLVATDENGSIAFANPAAERLLGRSTADVAGHDIYEFLSYDPAAPDAIFSGNRWTREMLLTAADGERIDVSVSRSFLFSDGAEERGKLYVIQDQREIKDLRNRLMLTDRLATAGEMSAAIAHEIRNPLGAISGSVQMIQKSPDLDEDQRYFMDIIVRESERLNTTLNDFLTFARQPVFSPNKIDLIKVTRETLDLLCNSPQVGESHGIRLEVAGKDSLQGLVDPNMFKQLIYNLVLNGVRAMPDGGMLTVSLVGTESEAVLDVVDSGVGMAPERLDSMFRPFATGSSGGTGLGLAVVYRIVQEHGGRIHVRSKQGSGTEVTVRLPLKRSDASNFSVTVEAAEPRHGTYTHSR